MPLAIMPYRSTRVNNTLHSRNNSPMHHQDDINNITSLDVTPSIYPPSTIPKSASSRSLYDGTKYVLSALAGLMTTNNNDNTDIQQHNNKSINNNSSIDITDTESCDSEYSSHSNSSRYMDNDYIDLCDFLPTTTRSFTPLHNKKFTSQDKHTLIDLTINETYINNVTDIVTNSIKHSLSYGIYSKILVVGEYAEQRSRYISRTTDKLPVDVCSLHDINNNLSYYDNTGVIVYSNTINDIYNIDNNVFDCIIIFDLSLDVSDTSLQWLYHIQRVLKNNGILAGTGYYRTVSNNNTLAPFTSNTISSNSSNASSSSDDEQSDIIRYTLREFRDCIEQTGMDCYTVIDISLEGINTTLHKPQNTVYGRFMASKLNDDIINYYEQQHNNNNKLNTQYDSISMLPTPSMTPVPQLNACDFNSTTDISSTSTPTHYNITNVQQTQSQQQCNTYEPVSITGISIGLPNGTDTTRNVFDIDNFNRLVNGEQQIAQMTEYQKNQLVQQRVFQLIKHDNQRIKSFFDSPDQVLKVNSTVHGLDLHKQYNIPKHVVDALDLSCQYAVAAGIEALKNANINVYNSDNELVGLPLDMQDDTGIIFASSFPGLDSLVYEVNKYTKYMTLNELKLTINQDNDYEYDRKLLFKLLVLANCQLAELIHAKGPNTQINAACSGTTQAVTIAHDWIRLNRCKRVIVIAGDVATSDRLHGYLSSGFMALGAATKCSIVTDAAAPFDSRRSGMIMGAGAVGLVLESYSSIQQRGLTWSQHSKAQIIDSHVANSAFHACLMDKKHITQQLQAFVDKLEQQYNINRHELANELLYISHETGTSVCADIELHALKNIFGNSYHNIKIANTKGYTGHAMGVAFEEPIAIYNLYTGLIPPIANLQTIDSKLDLLPEQLVNGGVCQRKYVLRFAAGFGSQLVYILYAKVQ